MSASRPTARCSSPTGTIRASAATTSKSSIKGGSSASLRRAAKYTVAKARFDHARRRAGGPRKSLPQHTLSGIYRPVAMGEKAHHPIEEYAEKADRPALQGSRPVGAGQDSRRSRRGGRDRFGRQAECRRANRWAFGWPANWGWTSLRWSRSAKDPAPEVRRELALSLRHSKSPAAPAFGPPSPPSTTARIAGISKPSASAPISSGMLTWPPT